MKSQSLFASLGALALVVGGAGSSAAQSTTSGVPSLSAGPRGSSGGGGGLVGSRRRASSAAREQASGRRFSASLRARLRGEMSGTSLADLETFKAAGATGRLPQAVVVTQALGGSLRTSCSRPWPPAAS